MPAPGGLYAVIDAGPEWYAKLSSPLAAWADPGWIGFHTPEEFRELFTTAGFQRACWIDLLPGSGVALGRKPSIAALSLGRTPARAA